MGFKKENYTPQGLCACMYIFLFSFSFSVFGQSHCPIRVDYEPREESQIGSAIQMEEVKFPFFQQWKDLNNLRTSDNEGASITLAGGKRSTLFKGLNLGFKIPAGAKISGIELIVEGYSQGEGSAEGQSIKLLNSDGVAIGINKANSALPIDKDWKKSSDSTDFIWRYGSSTDTWGVNLYDELVNSKDFGYALQVRNKLTAPISIFIDQIQMIVYYTPLYEICSNHACVPFYIDEDENPLVTYEWYIPQGFELISDSEEDPTINIGVSYASFGQYEICVESFYDQISQGQCCRKFNYVNCEPALISGHVFFDKNNDSSNNIGDEGIKDILVNLYTSQGLAISSTLTDINGDYSFPELLAGQYYIEVINNIDSLLFTHPNIGDETKDSDITGTFGEGTTALLSVDSGESLENIDAGFNLALTIGDFVWEDLNGDGIQQIEEPGIEGVLVKLTDSNNTVFITNTDQNGLYSFSGLPAGNYLLEFSNIDGYIATNPNETDNHLDSDYVPGSAILLTFASGGKIDSIDAGYYRPSTIGDFVWEDTNNNGLQDDSEPGIPGVVLNLIDSHDEVVQSITSDSLGLYQFKDIAPGEYYIEIQAENRYYPTEYNIGGGVSDGKDSDVFVQDDKFISTPFKLTSNTQNFTLDFGFIEKPVTLGGFTFLDVNNSGQYDPDETFLEEIKVYIYNSSNNLIDSTISDQGGFYLFENLQAGSYYLIFELRQEDLFTISDLGDDVSDSDVTNAIASGSTDLFTLMPDEENYTISAGYQKKPKVGDFIWLDTNNNGIQDSTELGLNDVLVELFDDQNQLIQTAFTGPNPESLGSGFYLFQNLDPGNYYIRIPEIELYNFAIVDENALGLNSTITNENGIGTSYTFSLVGNQSNLDIDAGYAYKKGGIKGEVWIDNNEDGVQAPDDLPKSGILISLYSQNGSLLDSRISNETGQYSFTELDEGNYFIIFIPTDQYRFTSPFASTDISLDSDVIGENSYGSTNFIAVMDGVTVEHIDAGLIDGVIDLKGTTWIDDNGDGIQQDEEDPLANVKIELFNSNDSLLVTTNSDLDGTYAFENNLAGQYYLVFTPENESYINTIADQGNDDNLDDDVTSTIKVGSTDIIEIAFFQEKDLINAGFYQFSTIGDQVFIDVNENGINDNEPGLDNVIVSLYNESGMLIAIDTTAKGGGLDSGYYLLENIPPGTYTVQFTRPLFYQFVLPDQGGDDSVDSDVSEINNNTGTTKPFQISSGSSNLTIDAGVFYQIPTESSITGIVWDDTNSNGIRDNDEMPISQITMMLENQNGDILDMTVSDMQGIYLFDNLPEGFYTVKAIVTLNKVATFANVGMDDSIDSDFRETPEGLKTDAFFLANFEAINQIDLGLVNKLNVGDFVWEDANNNGTQDAGELGIEEIEITITSENGIISETIMSDTDGAYQFTGLPAGFYTICAKLPSGFNFAKSNVGTDLLDSDVDISGCTSLLDFTSGGTINDLDIGFTKNGSIEGIAFIDLNGNGINNTNDAGLDGVKVNLHSDTGELIESTTTSVINDIHGKFEFKNLKATDYYLVFEFPQNYIITNPNVGDDNTDSDITGAFGNGSTDLFALPSGGLLTNLAGGAYLPASIGDEVWLDENADGIRNEEEEGVPNITVIIFRSFGVPFDTTVTDESGNYYFENLKQGLYFIQFVIPQEFAISPSDQGNDDNIDSDADNTGKTPLISLAHGADLKSIDCGIIPSQASLRSIVWNDINADGIRQNQEARIPGIKITLTDHLDNIIDSTKSNSLGLYAFEGIPAGEYKIMVHLEDTDYIITLMNMDDDDLHDCDVMPSGESLLFTSYENESSLSVPNIDIGLYESGGINGIVWEDINADGIYDISEFPIPDLEVSLYSKDAILIQKTHSTSDQENVLFGNIPPGEYFISYKVNPEYVSSPLGADILEDNNSDITEFEGIYITPTFHVLANEIVSNIDAGFYMGAKIKTDIWYDQNANGIQDDNGETPVHLYATLYDRNGIPKGTKGANQEGQIEFKGIRKGEYYIKYYSSTYLNFTQNVGGEEINSDVDHSFGLGTTRLFDFAPYETYTHIDAGLLQKNKKVYGQKLNTEIQEENETRNSELGDQANIDFEVHPNPAANYIRIKIDSGQPEGNLSIRNNQNQLVFNKKVKNTESINLSEFHPGVYYVKYQVNGKSKTKKILKVQ